MEIAEKPLSEIKTANEWIHGSKKRPIPGALFGEYWRQGETAILFAESGKGKSALAMQIGQSIASGKRIKPFKAAGKPQKVLFLDFEMNDKQFEMRHAADHDGGRAKFLRKHFVFSDNLCREELDPADFWVKGERTCDVFKRAVRRLVKKTDASVVIIDSLTCLKRSYYGAREILDLVTELKKLQREMNISILALLQTSKQAEMQALSINSLRGMKLLCGRADSVFGIGQSRFDPFGRYIKRIKSLGDAIDFDAMHVPVFRLKKLGGNFLGFEFQGFMPEIELLSDIRASKEWNLIEKIKRMSEGGDGMSIRAIAAKLDLPKTTVHRLLHMWRPPSSPPYEGGVAAASADGVVLSEYDPKKSKYYFPGREEYDEAGRNPKFKNLNDYESEEQNRLRREAYMIEAATAEARQEYKKTGKAPKLAEMLARMSEPPASAGGKNQNAGSMLGDAVNVDSDSTALPPAHAGGSDMNGEVDNPFGIPGLKHQLDAYDKDIWVEEADSRGKHIRWYSFDSNGKKVLSIRTTWGVTRKRIE